MSRPEHNLREFFRVPYPGIPCTITHKGKRHELAILDISIAGLAIILPPESYEMIQEGETYKGCTFSTPAYGEINVTLLVRNIQELNEGSALHFRRAGCSFVSIKPQTQALLMQYIAHLERENHRRQAHPQE